MAENWQPSAISTGGIYQDDSFGSQFYNNYIAYMDLKQLRDSNTWVNCETRNNHGSASIPGRPGPIADAVVSGSGTYIIAEFNVKKPDDATFLRQTIRVTYVLDVNQRTHQGMTIKQFTISYVNFHKCIYQDSTSDPSVSLIKSCRVAGVYQGALIISGDPRYGTGWNVGTASSNLRVSFGNYDQDGHTFWGSCLSWMGEWFALHFVGLNHTLLDTQFSTFELDVDENPTSDDDDNDGDNWDGGNGDHDDSSDIIMDPDVPGAGTASPGFLTLYSASASLLKTFADTLYDTSAWAEIKKYFTHPLDWIVSCVMLPFPPTIIGSASPVWGLFTWPVTLSLIEQYKTIDCGNMPITEYWGNFMDYSPFTKIVIWLPYIGYRELDVDMVMGHILHLKYIVDCCSGDCSAILSIDAVGISGPDIPKIVGQYYGNCGAKVPISQISHDALIQASISGLIGAGQTAVKNAGAAVSALSGGDPGSAITDMVNNTTNWAANTSINVINGLKPEVSHTGVCGMVHGFCSAQKPFIVKTIPIQSLPENFRLQHGYMTNRSGKLSDFDGYVEVESIQLNNVPAYEEELKEIIALLRGGVII